MSVALFLNVQIIYYCLIILKVTVTVAMIAYPISGKEIYCSDNLNIKQYRAI